MRREGGNAYLDKFDKEFEGRGVKVLRYADDIILLVKSIRAAERLFGTSTEYLEKKLKLKVNTETETLAKYWTVAGSGILIHTITNERLARRGYHDISEAYKSLHSL